MRRREFITSLASTITAWPFAGLAQTASKVYRIGVLSTDKPLPEPIFGAIVRALASHGYMPDRNVALELRASGDRIAARVAADGAPPSGSHWDSSRVPLPRDGQCHTTQRWPNLSASCSKLLC
jgi:hypothetical protein